MTDKQIIIDEVDVSGCEKQGETIAGITCGNGERIRLANEIITKHKLCKDNPNCVYKQLKRKEQACKEWKEEYRAKVEELNELEEKLLRKEQECDQLKVQLLDQKVKTLKDSGIICVLKQTLTEIKGIAEEDFYHTCWKTYARQLKQILQKISECEVENEM